MAKASFSKSGGGAHDLPDISKAALSGLKTDYESTGLTVEELFDLMKGHGLDVRETEAAKKNMNDAISAAGVSPNSHDNVVKILSIWNVLEASSAEGVELSESGAGVGGTAPSIGGEDPTQPGSKAERVRYRKLFEDFADLPQNKNKIARTGWSKAIPGYQVLCFGNSSEDWGKIVLCFLGLYGFVVLFFWAMLEFYLATDSDFGALYTFAALCGAAWLSLAAIVIYGIQTDARAKAMDVSDLKDITAIQSQRSRKSQGTA